MTSLRSLVRVQAERTQSTGAIERETRYYISSRHRRRHKSIVLSASTGILKTNCIGSWTWDSRRSEPQTSSHAARTL